jgi:hypothetical protein
MILSEVVSETALPRLLDDAVLARAYGLAYPAAFCGIVAGSLLAAPLVALLGLTGTLVAAGSCVLVVAALLLHRPLGMAVGTYTRTAPLGPSAVRVLCEVQTAGTKARRPPNSPRSSVTMCGRVVAESAVRPRLIVAVACKSET